MHERERWQVIKALLRERSLVRIADACRATGVSEASIRRDFARLAEQGVAIRVHGGLEALPDTTANTPGDVLSLATRSFDVSQTLNIDAKRAIAKAAVALCADGETIIINGGTTTYQMGEYLRERRLKVLTNSYLLADALIHTSKCRVALPGGEVYREQGMIVSPFEEDAIQHYSATRMFMSAISIGPLGVIEGDPLLARAESKLLKRADKLIVLADSSKFVSRGSLVVCPLSRIDTLITDSDAPNDALDMLRGQGVRVVIVDASAQTTAAA
ncbi:DeoR/GlpR family DNA-binding transcription regulator [Bradyrhizobium guangzhouense]|uniref:DeoR/GlpR transcriptional regulator n=1 Tax=Bradyrhizobium guangzhouense TaxID=1325095 RepID=A0AAE5X7P5_9BRAD|nr:DeoR/GlpR family DNA-binding transcription regulator [Bradyrhizobium guangzhouense]QAU50293.1 DeoR/GlpR transcriptional regulator [Bradyrhizobium guangzhouense]RXH15119.1 DeoR/GlpR transcriptional regulator [Bradyrhizobium guangzhouense]RXH18991.1 DeoR/GlpR transcriptional regulator [Bradyrhizobium guangzhouense]